MGDVLPVTGALTFSLVLKTEWSKKKIQHRIGTQDQDVEAFSQAPINPPACISKDPLD